jgi:hypothetical protein
MVATKATKQVKKEVVHLGGIVGGALGAAGGFYGGQYLGGKLGMTAVPGTESFTGTMMAPFKGQQAVASTTNLAGSTPIDSISSVGDYKCILSEQVHYCRRYRFTFNWWWIDG